MKRINNRGVVLLETLIVSVFVLAISVFVYRNAVPLMGRYEKLEDFDDVDSVYAANLIKNMVISNIGMDNIGNKILVGDNKYFANISDCDAMISEDTPLYLDSNYCKTIKSNLNIGSNDFIYITGYGSMSLNKFRDYVNDELGVHFADKKHDRFKDYLKTVANGETFYSKAFYNSDEDLSEINVTGFYRVFISRTVEIPDYSSDTGYRYVKKYANIGIYKKNN